ncbi:MAG: hypothetical protein LBL78_01485 [Prevotellaceae bacterium]|jgi:hypothetical protein|nr:hypothetical protein [Prevotellaceae bacterium]
MAQLFRTSLLILTLLFLWGRGGDTLATLTATAGHEQPTAQQATSCINATPHAYALQATDPNVLAGQHINPVYFARTSRASLHNDEFVALPVNRRLVSRTDMLARLGEQRAYIHPARLTHSACDYYIFALRRILI